MLDLSGNGESAASQLDPSPGPSPDLSLDAGLDPDPDRYPEVPGGADLAETDTPPPARQGLTGRDPATGQVRGILRGVPPTALARQDLASTVSEPGLEILFSRGLPDASAWRP